MSYFDHQWDTVLWRNKRSELFWCCSQKSIWVEHSHWIHDDEFNDLCTHLLEVQLLSVSIDYENNEDKEQVAQRWNDITWESTSQHLELTLLTSPSFSWTIWPPFPKAWDVERHNDDEMVKK